MMKFLKFMLFSAVVLTVYSMWKFQSSTSREILQYGLVKAESRYGNGDVVARSREVRQGTLQFWEVELPRGSWIACEKDCSDQLRRNSIDQHEGLSEDK